MGWKVKLYTAYMWVGVWTSPAPARLELTSIQKCHRCASLGSEAPELSSVSRAFGVSPCSSSLCRYFKCE